MKLGMSLQELAVELDRQSNAKMDYMASSKQVSVVPIGKGRAHMTLEGIENDYAIDQNTHNQLGTFLEIPNKFYHKILNEHQDIYADTVNRLLERNDKVRMVRTLDGRARAFLSNSYKLVDNSDVVPIVLRTLIDVQAQIVSSSITDKKVYIKALFPKIEADITVGDPVQAGIVVTNSEVGLGRLQILPLIYRLVCTNGMIREDGSLNKRHLGSRFEHKLDSAQLYYKTDTVLAQDKAFVLELRDTVQAIGTHKNFLAHVDKLRGAATRQITGDVVAAVQVLKKKETLTDEQGSGILKHLITGGDLSQWGLANAVTRYSQDVESYDTATDLEALGGKIIDLSPKEWSAISTAAA